ncbi:MAG: Thioredoxin-related protein [Verrucomicrobiaceae bacterium]|nr:Thioredoxin-related protein [Verrucomicrobiaceae bacterium]MDB6119473.1 Thioredoxin-related protein [Verrucomicrobiaceae bacterium]
MKTIIAALALFITGAAMAGGPKPVTDLNAALAKAKAEGKMLFVQMGRENCGNCQALKAMIKSNQVRLSDSKFVYADVNVDDSATNRLFSAKFDVKGNVLPFVAIASPDGTKLVGRSGYGSAKEFDDLIREAGKQSRKPAAVEKK